MAGMPSEHLKPLADRLAHLLASSDNEADLLQLLNRFGFMAGSPASHSPAPHSPAPHSSGTSNSAADGRNEVQPAADGGLPVGIWHPVDDAGRTRFVRDPDLDPMEAAMWADVAAIEPKGARPRVVLVGESVARGFFFDPYYSLAEAMQQLPGGVGESADEELEIVDLARCDLTLDGLKTLTRRSFDLEPDAVVIFAGNNWIAFNDGLFGLLPTLADRLRATGSVSDVARDIERCLATEAERFVDELAALSASKDVPVLFVLPDFNLVDFASDMRRSPPFMRNSETEAQWFTTFESALTAEQDGEWNLAGRLAERLVELDGNTSSASWSLLARCQQQMGHSEAAEQAWERARDAEIWHPTTTPRCFGVTLKALRAAAENQELPLVDLPARFREWLSGDLPDRRVFLDYCHLTVDGMRVAAAAIIEAVLPLIGLPTADWRDLAERVRRPSPQVIARSYMLAAHHNASWGQREEIIRHLCERAQQQTPEAVQLAMLWSGVLASRIPPFFCPAWQDAVKMGDPMVMYRVGTIGPFMHEPLANALLAAFGPHEPSISERIEHTRRRDHDVVEHDTDLLESYCCAVSWVQPEATWQRQRAYLEARTARSEFVFFASRPVTLAVRLTCRLPEVLAGGNEVCVSINGFDLTRLELTADWKTSRCEVPAIHVSSGLNRLVLSWPTGLERGTSGLSRAMTALARHERPDLLPVYGQLFALTATALR